jgi:hypothetical protein
MENLEEERDIEIILNLHRIAKQEGVDNVKFGIMMVIL